MMHLFARAVACLFAYATLMLTAAPMANAALAQVDLREFKRLSHGYAVQATVGVTCDPVGPDTRTYLSLTLFQGTYPHKNHIEGFGGVVDPTQPPIVCDGTAHEYSFTVRPNAAYADRKFRAGPATAIYVVTQCTEVAPENFQCTPTADETRERVRITPR